MYNVYHHEPTTRISLSFYIINKKTDGMAKKAKG